MIYKIQDQHGTSVSPTLRTNSSACSAAFCARVLRSVSSPPTPLIWAFSNSIVACNKHRVHRSVNTSWRSDADFYFFQTLKYCVLHFLFFQEYSDDTLSGVHYLNMMALQYSLPLHLNLLRSADVPERTLFPAAKECASWTLSDLKGVRRKCFLNLVVSFIMLLSCHNNMFL